MSPPSVAPLTEPESNLISSPSGENIISAAHECALSAVRDFRLKHSKNLIISHYNVNSIRHKFCEISPLIAELHIDILAITESKLDDSFPSEQFNICNYKLDTVLWLEIVEFVALSGEKYP